MSHSSANIVVAVAIGAVFVILLLGLFNMVRSGNDTGNRSQKLMRWRVGLQFLAIVIIMGALWFRR